MNANLAPTLDSAREAHIASSCGGGRALANGAEVLVGVANLVDKILQHRDLGFRVHRAARRVRDERLQNVHFVKTVGLKRSAVEEVFLALF